MATLSHCNGGVTRRSAVLCLAVLCASSPAASRGPDLLAGDDTIQLTLEAPLGRLFERGQTDENFTVPGTLTYTDARTGEPITLRDVVVSARGHSSRRETECTFPKLKLKIAAGVGLKIGTHCGETDDGTLSAKYGRLSNERSPHREALAYRLLEAAGVPTLRTRPARIAYVDGGKAPLVRNALLVEDDDDAGRRLGGTKEIPLEAFGSVQSRRAAAEGARIAFGEAMIGNFDWCLKYTPDDIYRCDDSKPLWNVLAFDRGNGSVALVAKDFDLAGAVAGSHTWFGKVFNRGFVPSKSERETEVVAQVQRTRTLFPRATLDAERRHFLDRKSAVYGALDKADVDADGRAIARDYLDAFYAAIADDQYYRTVVGKAGVRVYADAARGAEACGRGDLLREGTPVDVRRHSGDMSEVILLDALWRWADKDPCPAVLNGPVWIRSDAITRNYP